jgi:hypothetical protein
LALILHDRGLKDIVGLTSGKNFDFVKSLGWYSDKVSKGSSIVYCDVAGDQYLNLKIHARFGDKLIKHVNVGMSHISEGSSFGVDGAKRNWKVHICDCNLFSTRSKKAIHDEAVPAMHQR